ncbi:importin-13-like protein cdm [Rhodnius prolixus]|uniref:importin-13-like protein cdm n=1 Tax=Rhodnius prolixus TaxID=13249 RepID=UPI003D18A1A6
MEITLENVERALAQFYHTNSTLQAEAHQWLTAVQCSPNAWAFVWDLLQPNRTCEAQFFAATTLHMKLMKQWSEVPQEQYENLKSKLLEVIIQYSAGPKIVLNRLCIALSAFVIQTTPRFWTNSLQDLLNIFQPGNLPNIPEERSIWILLEVLTVIPEEFQTMTLGQAHEQSVRRELEQITPKVISLIESLLECADNAVTQEIRAQAVKAVVPWLALGAHPLPSCIHLSQKLVSIINVQSSDLTEACEIETEALTQIVTHPNTHHHPTALLQVLDVILPLRQLVINSENQDFVMNIYKLLITFGESHTKLLINTLGTEHSALAETLIHCMLQCISTKGQYPRDECHSKLTFGFWYILQDELTSSDKEVYQKASPYVVPAYKQLCSILLVKSKLPPDEMVLTASETELLRIYRQDITDTIVCCYYMTRDYLIELLTETMSAAQTWQDAEAVIEIVISLAETTWPCSEDLSSGSQFDTCIDTAESTTSKLTRLLVSVPPRLVNKRLINSINHAIGAYAEWWSTQRDVLGQLIPTLVASIQNPETSTSATMALKDITRECTTTILPYAEDLLNSCQDALSKGRLKQVECLRLMYSIGRLLSILPYGIMLARLEPLVNSYTSDIERLLTEPLSTQGKSAVLLRLRMLGTICSSLYLGENVKADPPTLLTLTRILPVLNQVTNQHSNDPSIVQEVCSCLKSSVLSLMERSESVLEPIVNITLACYTSQPNTAALDLTKQLFMLFGKNAGSGEIIIGLVRSISVTTMTLVMNNKASEASDVVQAYYQLTNNIVKKSPSLIHLAVDPAQLFKFATVSLLLPESGTIRAAGTFLCSCISQSRDHPMLLAAVQQNGEHLVHTVLRCIGGETPRSGLDIFSDILLALNKKYCDNLARWLNSTLAQENFPTERATPESKAHFTKMILRERANRHKVLDRIKEFSLICRGLIGTDYNRPTAN